MKDARLYRVGELFSPERADWPEGPHLWLDDGAIRLALFLTGPTPQEIATFKKGQPRFAWTEQGVNGYLLFTFADAPWSDAPFNPQRLTEPFALQPGPRGTHEPVVIFLVHADTGRIAAIRILTWPAYFLNHVIASVRRLETHRYAEPEARAAQQDFYRRYPGGRSLYRLVQTLSPEARCVGGQRDDRPQDRSEP